MAKLKISIPWANILFKTFKIHAFDSESNTWEESDFSDLLGAEQEIISDIDATIDVKGNHTYLCGTLTSLTLQSVEDSPRESVIRFKSGSTPTTLTLPATLEVVGWTVPQANYSYEISIANNRAIIAYFETL